MVHGRRKCFSWYWRRCIFASLVLKNNNWRPSYIWQQYYKATITIGCFSYDVSSHSTGYNVPRNKYHSRHATKATDYKKWAAQIFGNHHTCHRERRYFISSCSSLSEGTPYHRTRWRQVVDDHDTAPEKVHLVVPQPAAAEIYYSACAAVDHHNRHRQDTLCIERKLVTHDWSKRVNLSILAIIIVDTWLAYKLMTFVHDENQTGEAETTTNEVQKDFYCHLAAELIDNNYETVVGGRKQQNDSSPSSSEGGTHRELFHKHDGAPRCGIAAHLTPTKRKRKNQKGELQNRNLQGRCRVCSMKTIYTCSLCVDDDECHDAGWLCGTSKGRTCFADHLAENHNIGWVVYQIIILYYVLVQSL